MDNVIEEIFRILENKCYDLSSEVATQDQINNHLQDYALKRYPALMDVPYRWAIAREMRLSKKDIVDFFINPYGIAIEVKTQGSPIDFLKQCERYCKHDKVKALILATAKFTGFPPELSGKPIYVIHLSRGML